VPRIVVTVYNAELAILLRLANEELRRPQDQLRFIRRKELEVHNQIIRPTVGELELASDKKVRDDQ